MRTIPATGIAAIALLLASGAAPDARSDEPLRDLKQLIERIAGDDATLADAATEQLIDQIVAPLVDAIDSSNDRPIDAQLRLDVALRQLYAELRARLFRADLPAPDRELYDRFAEAYPRVVRRLFDGEPIERITALGQIPLEPGTGAGVLLVARVSDRDGDVAERALELAMRLKDEVIARNLGRYVHEIMGLVDSGFFKTQHPDVKLVVGLFVQRAIRIIAETGSPAALPDILAAVEHYGRDPDSLWQMRDVLESLGKLGDERAVATMRPYLADPTLQLSNLTPDGERATQTVGDAALYGLLRIFKLDAGAFGFVHSEDQQFYGFVNDARRTAGHRKFDAWYRENAARPSADRKPPPPAKTEPDADEPTKPESAPDAETDPGK
jgi:hypothetical protein